MHTKPLLANLVTYITIHICFKETEDTANQQKLPYAQVDMSKKKKKKDDKQLKVHSMYVSNQLNIDYCTVCTLYTYIHMYNPYR